ncbi:hypothetical protein HZU40_11870 [Mycolicibacterium fluoranthenivorans]|uniref:Uncharacterized protein n=1 Tax=Mycolicibacterium fluoranthenivorans TaxID=258505 RepID=A0A7G8PKL0_9MYCO|nr:hypothetical protein [Mycolicibacterium fluoranthenivorans]QNJ94876.1 hypothetical protein HZU40_11870 [Mycolicibacterium fluoranthenivorans]
MEICTEITERVEETVFDPVENWVKKTERVCRKLPWPISLLCDLVTTFVKVITYVARTIVHIYITVVCTPIVIILSVIASIINLITTLPIIGPIYRWIFGSLVWLGSQVVGLLDAAASLFGILIIKHIRLHIIILMREDGTLTVDPSLIDDDIKKVEQIYRQRARIKIHTTVHKLNTPAVHSALHVDSGVGLLGEDLTETGMYFQSVIRDTLWPHGAAFTIKIFAPIVAFVVEGVGDTQLGCSAGPLADYLCVEGSTFAPTDPLTMFTQARTPTLAHEIGHACALAHDTADITNLMYPRGTDGRSVRGTNLSPFQRAIVRSSPHVTYL